MRLEPDQIPFATFLNISDSRFVHRRTGAYLIFYVV
jgi:hypothetical protein